MQEPYTLHSNNQLNTNTTPHSRLQQLNLSKDHEEDGNVHQLRQDVNDVSEVQQMEKIDSVAGTEVSGEDELEGLEHGWEFIWEFVKESAMAVVSALKGL